MKKIFLLSAALFCAAGSLYADPVTAEMAMAAADQWVARNPEFKAGGKALSVFSVCDTNAAKTVLWHQVRMAGDGMLIVAPATEIEPVIAALDNDPGELPAAHPLRAMLVRDLRKRLRFLGLYEEDAKSGASLKSVLPVSEEEEARMAEAAQWAAQQEKKWAKLGVRTARGAKLMANDEVGVTDIAVEIGIVKGFEKNGAFTHWNQSTGGGGKCYNYYTPDNCVCGCVATALSAMLQFFNVSGAPDEPYSSDRCYVNGVKTTKETIGDPDGNMAYDWTILPTNYGGEAEASDELDEQQRELLGRVAYNAGVAVSMQWSAHESSAFEFEIATALRDAFGFKDARAILNLKPEHYKKVIYAQNQCGVPVALGISSSAGIGGHSVLAVGYGRDVDNVERVRIFCGWAGVGDAWYALPYIDTKSTESGGGYLFDVVDEAVTMIAYEDENAVPVCGVVLSTNAEITVTADGNTGAVNTNGYFGIRVAPSEKARNVDVIYENADKSNTNSVEVSADTGVHKETINCIMAGGDIVKIDCEYFGDAASLPVLDNLVLLFVNSKSAASYSDAVALGLKENLPVLFFSGTPGEYNSDAAWRLIKELDETDGANDPYFSANGGFTDKFVLAYFPFNPSDAVSDVNPSYGVFDPRKVQEVNRWTWYNARLTYDTVSDYVLETNVVAAAEEGEPATTNVVVWAAETTTNAVMNVLTNGTALYNTSVENIRLEILYESIDGVSFRNRTLTDTFRAGQKPAFAVPSIVHEDCSGLLWTNLGWVVYQVVQEEEGVVTNMLAYAKTNTTGEDFPELEADGVYILDWRWEYFGVRVRASIGSEGNAGTIDLDEDLWVPYGEEVVITAHPNTEGLYPKKFGWWEIRPEEEDYALTVDEYPDDFADAYGAPFPGVCVTEGTSIRLSAWEPVDLTVYFEDADDTAPAGGYALTMTATPAELVDNLPSLLALPAVSWGTEPIAYGTTDGYLAGPATFALASTNVTNLGTNWVCTGWVASTNGVAFATGSGGRAFFDFSEDVTLVWKWEVVPESGELKPGKVPFATGGASPLVLAPGELSLEVANTVKGWWYGLYTTTDLTADDWTCVWAQQASADDEVLVTLYSFDTTSAPMRFFKIILTETKPEVVPE